MSADEESIIDNARSWCLCVAGRDDHDFIAAVAVGVDGSEHLVLAERSTLGKEDVRYHPGCPDVEHEQIGPLPIEFVRRAGDRPAQGAPVNGTLIPRERERTSAAAAPASAEVPSGRMPTPGRASKNWGPGMPARPRPESFVSLPRAKNARDWLPSDG